jgi:hypothetical protein
MLKKILLIAVFCVTGFLIGGIVNTAIVSRNMSKGLLTFTSSEMEVCTLGKAANEAYFEEPNEAAVKALRAYLQSLDGLMAEQNVGESKRGYFLLSSVDGVMARARLGNLYYRMGQKDKAQEHFRLATVCAKGTCFEAMKTEEEWLKLVQCMDEAAVKRHEGNE